MSYPAKDVAFLENYRHYRITLHQESGQWCYLCHRPYVLEGFSNGTGYDKPSSARTAARVAINLDITLQSVKQVLDGWLQANRILHREYMQATNQLYLTGKQLSR